MNTTSIKRGSTAADRRVLAAVSATSSAPTNATQGNLTSGTEYLNLLFQVGGTTPSFTVQPWAYSFISGTWHQVGSALTVATTKEEKLSWRRDGRIYLQITAVSGSSPTLTAWIEEVQS